MTSASPPHPSSARGASGRSRHAVAAALATLASLATLAALATPAALAAPAALATLSAPAALPVAALPPATAAAAATDEPVRVQFAPGRSAASLPVEFSVGSPGAERRFVVAAKAGQELRVSLSIPVKDPMVQLWVACPGDGHTAIGRAGGLSGSLVLPATGDYTVGVTSLATRPLPPGALTVAVTGAPRMIAARPYTGTYYRRDGSRSSIDVAELGGGRLRFSLTAFYGALDSPFGPNLGTAHGTVELRDGVAVYSQGTCRLTLRFGRAASGNLHIDEAGDCGFGHNVTAQGDYHRTSLCAAPETGSEPE
jgi:hypothetical protein